MIYDTYIDKAYKLVLEQDEETGIWYINPNWIHLLYTNGMEIENIHEEYISKYEIKEALMLEVKRRNIKLEEKKQVVIDWLYNIIKTEIEPQMLQEETEYVAQIIEYLKFREKTAGTKNPKQKKEFVLPSALTGMDFSKK